VSYIKWIVFFLTFILAVSVQASATSALRKIEQQSHIKMGVYAMDTANGDVVAYRANTRFPCQSTMKLLVSAAALKTLALDQTVSITAQDLVRWSPVVRLHLNRGYMTISELIQAAMRYSDNAATNRLIDELGGVDSINQFARAIGNSDFYLAHREPNLNSNLLTRADTATPKSMAKTVQALLLSPHVLTQAHRELLTHWMLNNTTGYHRIRAGLPLGGWYAAEKTGGSAVVSNDIGIVGSLACQPIVLVINTWSDRPHNPKQEAAVAAATQAVLAHFAKHNRCFAATAFK
jgi:beta-lactamase class A